MKNKIQQENSKCSSSPDQSGPTLDITTDIRSVPSLEKPSSNFVFFSQCQDCIFKILILKKLSLNLHDSYLCACRPLRSGIMCYSAKGKSKTLAKPHQANPLVVLSQSGDAHWR